MGDGINTPFDVFMFVMIFAGVPALILASPIVLLVAVRAIGRRRRAEGEESASRASWPIALILIACFVLCFIFFLAPISVVS